jgi:hypothetical protein
MKMKIHDNFKGKIKRVAELLAKRYRGFPVGVIVGIAIVAGTSVYAAPMLLSSKPVNKTVNNTPTIQHLSQGSDTKQSNKSSTNTPTNTTTPTDQSDSTTSSISKSSSSPTSNGSSSTSSSVSSSPTKPAPTMTGIAVITPDPGQTEIMSVPACDWESINSGTPEVCHHYVPLSFVLDANYSDGTTTQIPWSEATFTSLGNLIPDLFNVDGTNNTLIEGTCLGCVIGGSSNFTVPITVKYQNWSYIKYINFVENGLWGS